MSKPRELIANAVCQSFYGQPMASISEFRREICFKMADAVIDALEGMEVTEAMSNALWDAPAARTNLQTTETVWRAMVGAMRDE